MGHEKKQHNIELIDLMKLVSSKIFSKNWMKNMKEKNCRMKIKKINT